MQAIRRLPAVLVLAATAAVYPQAAHAQEFVYVLDSSGFPLQTSRCIFVPDGCQARLWTIDLSEGAVIGKELLGFVRPSLARSADGGTLYYPTWYGNITARSRVDLTTETITPSQWDTDFSYGATVIAAAGQNVLFLLRPAAVDVVENGQVTAIPFPNEQIRHLAVTPDGATAYVALSTGVAVIDVPTRTVTATITLSGTYGWGIALSPDGSRLFTVRTATTQPSSEATLYALNTTTREVVANRTVTYPGDLLVSPDGSRVWLSDGNAEATIGISTPSMRLLRTDTLAEISAATVTDAIGGIAHASDGRLLVTTTTTLTVIDPVTVAVSRVVTLPVGTRFAPVVLPLGAPCVFRVSPTTINAPSAGGNFSVNVPSDEGCVWRASTSQGWIRQLSPTGGESPGTVTFTLLANAGVTRTTTLSVAGQFVVVTQVAETVPAGAPGAPTDLTARLFSGGFVSLSWNPPASGAAPTHYIVEAGTASGDRNALVLPLGLVTTVGGGPLAPHTQFVRVRAANDAGASAPSNEVALNPAAPPQISSFQFVWISPAFGVMSWTEAVQSSVRFRVEAGLGSQTASFETGESRVLVPSNALPPGSYFLWVTGINSAGTQGSSPNIFVRFGVCSATPASPSITALNVAGRLVSLSIAAASPMPFSSFRVFAGTTPGGNELGAFDLVDTQISGVVPPGTYYVRVAAVNACGVGPPSPEQSFVVP